MRKKSSEHASKIEQARVTSGESRAFFQYITPSSYTPPATEYFARGTWINTPKGIISLEESHLTKHMYGRTRTYHSEGDNINPLTELDQNGMRLRKQIAESSGTEWKRYAPSETHEFLEMGKCKLTKEQKRDYDGIFTTVIPFESFTRYLNSKTKNKAPSVSGVKYV